MSVTEYLIKVFGPKFELDSNMEDWRIVNFVVFFRSLISTEKEKWKYLIWTEYQDGLLSHSPLEFPGSLLQTSIFLTFSMQLSRK